MLRTANPRIICWSILSFLCSLCLCGSSQAALDPELKSPYQVRVVLQVAEHRMLTPQFQKQLENELRDQLRLALGKLAQVEVVRFHPLLGDIRAKGLQAVLDAWDELASIETHFVLIDFVADQYQIQTGHHDGMTGLSSPVVRREVLSDRQRVADAAAQLVRKDFGLVGTFQMLEGKEVKLAIKGGGLVESLRPWVQRGDVFAVVRISDEAGKLRTTPLEWAILQVVERLPGGNLRCRYFCRYAEDRVLTDAGPGGGYRCVQLRTISGPVRVRLVNEKTQELLNGLRVVVSANDDFQSELVQGTTQSKGLFEAPGPFHHVAYVRVYAGGRVLVEFPVPLVDDRTVVCRMSPDPVAMQQGEIELRRARWVRWYVEALALADQRLGELPTLTPSTLEDALKLGRQHQAAMETEAARLAAERADLEQLAVKHKIKLDLGGGGQLAAALTKRQDQLAKWLDDLDKLIKEANSDQTRELIATVKRAEILEQQADFEKAMELYKSVLKARDSAEVRTHLDQLETAWATKSKEHHQARQFLYVTWPTLDLTAAAANFPKAAESFQTCKQAGDRLTPRKLLLVNIQHAKELAKELEVLRKAPGNEDNDAKLRVMLQLADRLRALQIEVEAWVAKDKAAAK